MQYAITAGTIMFTASGCRAPAAALARLGGGGAWAFRVVAGRRRQMSGVGLYFAQTDRAGVVGRACIRAHWSALAGLRWQGGAIPCPAPWRWWPSRQLPRGSCPSQDAEPGARCPSRPSRSKAVILTGTVRAVDILPEGRRAHGLSGVRLDPAQFAARRGPCGSGCGAGDPAEVAAGRPRADTQPAAPAGASGLSRRGGTCSVTLSSPASVLRAMP